MSNYEYIKGKGNRFSSTNQPAIRGRKPKLYTVAKNIYNISSEDYRNVFFFLAQKSRKDIEAIAKDDSTPI